MLTDTFRLTRFAEVRENTKNDYTMTLDRYLNLPWGNASSGRSVALTPRYFAPQFVTRHFKVEEKRESAQPTSASPC